MVGLLVACFTAFLIVLFLVFICGAVALGIFAVCLGFILLALGRRQLRERAMLSKLSEVRL